MKKILIKTAITLASLFLLGISIYELNKLYYNSRERQQYVSDLAYSNNIRFGFLNVDKWKSTLSDIIIKKVDELEFDDNLKQTMHTQIEKALYELINQIEIYLNQDKRQGNWLTQAFKTVAYEIVFDSEKFKKQVPQWSNEIVKSIISESNKVELKDAILQKFNEFMDQTNSTDNVNIQEILATKYEFDNYDDCVTWLNEQNIKLTTISWRRTWIILICITVVFVFYFLTPQNYRNGCQYYIGLLGVLTLLLGGLLTPMIEIDARISEVNFELLGESIVFYDQVLFFESKSVIDLVKILIEHGDVQTAAIGALVFTFSIIFPTLKLIVSAFAYPFPERIYRNKITRFFALKSGKWSMADVMVVAIFMSYIGFRSLIGSQLDHLSNIKELNMVSTHEHTVLQIGFFLFAAFCFSGIVFAYYVSKHLKQNGIKSE